MGTLKKAALGLMAIGFSCSALAAEYPIPPDIPTGEPVFQEPLQTKEGVYIGLGIGALDFDNKLTGSVDFVQDGSTINDPSQSNSQNNVGVNGVLDLGYSWTFPNRLFFGIEGFGNLTSAKNSQSLYKTQTTGDYTATMDDTVDLKWQAAYGARVLPGFQLNTKSVLYGIVGYTRGHANLSNSTDNSSITNNSTDTTDVISGSYSGASNSYNFDGYQLGLGTMIDLVEHLALRVDVIYSGYSSQTLYSKTSSFENGSATTSVTAQPYTVEGDLSLVYMFG